MVLSWFLILQAAFFLFWVLLDWVEWPPFNDLPKQRERFSLLERIRTTTLAAAPCFVALALSVLKISRKAIPGVGAFCLVVYGAYVVVTLFLTLRLGQSRHSSSQIRVQAIQLALAVACFVMSIVFLLR